MKNRLIKALAVITCISLLCGCTEVVYDSYSNSDISVNSQSLDNSDMSENSQSGDNSDASEASDSSDNSDSADSSDSSDTSDENSSDSEENRTKEYDMEREEFSEELSAEDLSENAENGEISMDGEMKIELTVPVSQFYEIRITAAAEEGGSVTLSVDGRVQGAYRIYKDSEMREYSVSGIYLPKGRHDIALTPFGDITLYGVSVTDADRISPDVYENPYIPDSGGENECRRRLLSYLEAVYGERSLTAQYCTPNSLAEIDAVYNATGRYPAIRFGDLMYYTKAGSKVSGAENTDIGLAVKWAENGGIVGYSHYWFAPVGEATFYNADCTMNTDNISRNTDILNLSYEELSEAADSGDITEEDFAVISDIDSIANQLKILCDKDIAVLFRPLPYSEDNRYWWDSDSTLYKYLWEAIYQRITVYHGLDNIIWVCSASDSEYFPDESYVDIVGTDYYEVGGSAVWAKTRADSVSENNYMTALTECAAAVNPDYMARDNVMWLWTACWCGDYIADENGRLRDKYITAEQLKYIYNHEVTVTRDEIDFEGMTEDE